MGEGISFSFVIENMTDAVLKCSLSNLHNHLQVIRRVALKAAIFGQDIDAATTSPGAEEPVTYKISSDAVAQLYKDSIMPLTKEVEVEYLLRRLD